MMKKALSISLLMGLLLGFVGCESKPHPKLLQPGDIQVWSSSSSEEGE